MAVERMSNVERSSTSESSGLDTVTSSVKAPEVRVRTRHLEPGGAGRQRGGEHVAVGELELVALELDPDAEVLLGVVGQR